MSRKQPDRILTGLEPGGDARLERAITQGSDDMDRPTLSLTYATDDDIIRHLTALNRYADYLERCIDRGEVDGGTWQRRDEGAKEPTCA